MSQMEKDVVEKPSGASHANGAKNPQNKPGDYQAEIKRYLVPAAVVFLIWLTGYFGFSVSWVAMGFVVWVLKDNQKQSKGQKRSIKARFTENEKEAVCATLADMPSWVYFPDVEKCEWLNKLIKQIWPYLGEYIVKILREKVEPSIKDSLPASLNSFKFEKIELGDKPIRVGGIKVYREEIRRDEIMMDLEIFYVGNMDVELRVSKLVAGIEDFQMKGVLRVIMKPLVNQIPFFGGLSAFFLNPPDIDFNLTNAANVLDIPGVSNVLRKVLVDQVSKFLVLPNRVVVPLMEGLDIDQLRLPLPQGVLRIFVKEAKDLLKKDNIGFMKGKSDPYCTIYVGAQRFKTKVISNSVCPQWNTYYEAIVDEGHGQTLQLELWDEDPGSRDESLGSVDIDLAAVINRRSLGSWLQLEDVKHGQVFLRMTWLRLSKDKNDLNKSIETIGKMPKIIGDQNLSSGILIVKLDSATNLRRKKSVKDPSTYCVLSLGNTTKKSKVVNNTSMPVWEEVFHFLVVNPQLQSIDIEVRKKKTNDALGVVSYPLSELLDAQDMMVERPFTLHGVGSNTISELKLKFCLRILTDNDSVDSLSEPTDNEMNSTTDRNEDYFPEVGVTYTDNESGLFTNGSASESGKRHVDYPDENSNRSGSKSGFGEIQVTTRYSSQSNKLILVIHKAVNLMPLDSNNLSDPYVRVYLLPNKAKSGRKKTRVIKDNLNPVFDERLEFPCNLQEVPQRTIDLVVKNSKSVLSKSKTFMGQVYIELSKMDLSKGTTEWYTLHNPEMDGSKVSIGNEII